MMVNPIYITVKSSRNEGFDICVSSLIKVNSLAAGLAETLMFNLQNYQVYSENHNSYLKLNMTLESQGVWDGDILTIE